MFPEDRVLVGVINRKRDFQYARDEHWYRIPQSRLPRGANAEYLAFFLSRAFQAQNGGIHYYAEIKGLELVYRRDLMPEQANHPRANDIYYKMQLGDLVEKIPPVLNHDRRTISFIYTTWDRFVHAEQIRDLYSKADYYVDRVYHALRSRGIQADRFWEAENREMGYAPQIRVLCDGGAVIASTDQAVGDVFLDDSVEEDEILAAILARIANQGGPVMLNVPLED